MSQVSALEQRVSALEKEVADLRRHAKPRETVRDWLDRISGSFKDDPEFEEIVRLGREIRAADRPDESEWASDAPDKLAE
jgi:hypothetical protein